MLWVIVVLLMWASGLVLGVAGNFIHVLLVIAMVVVVVNLLQRRRLV